LHGYKEKSFLHGYTAAESRAKVVESL